MATRIKRYEERLEHMPGLLERIEREMGPDAQIEQRLFRRGALLGLIGGQRMVEVVATVEVSDEQLKSRPSKRRKTDKQPGENGDGEAQVANASEAAEPAPTPAASRSMPPRIVPPPSELSSSAGRAPAARLDVRADDPLRVSMAGGGLELDATQPASPALTPSKPAPTAAQSAVAPVKPASKPPRAATPEAAALNQGLPVSLEPVTQPGTPMLEPGQLQTDLVDLRESITELKETVKLLVQAQARTARLEVQNTVAAKSVAQVPMGESAPEQTPEESLAQAAQQAQADEAQLLLELHGSAAPLEGATPAETASARVIADPLALDPSAALPAVQRQVYDRLLDWNIGPYDALELINTAIASTSAPEALSAVDILKVITSNICRNMLLSGGIKLGKTPPGKVVALVGATGVGKTTTIAKLAAKFAFQEGQRVSLVSLDNYRIAAAEQLRTYSEIMGIDLDIVFSKDEFDTQLTARRHCDLVLIDTAGRSPINTKQIYELREVFAAHPPDEVHLVVGASTKCDDLRAILENFSPLGYSHIIVSKLDETRSLGTIYNISKLCKHPISYVTVGQRVPEDIRTATLQFIQQWIEQGRAV